MSTNREREGVFTVNRLLVVVFILIGVWWDVSIPADVFSTVGTIFWLYMPKVAYWELKLFDGVKEYMRGMK